MTPDDHPEAPNGSDPYLVERVRAGDPDAFGQLYDRWFDRIHDLAYRILYDTEAAADVAQDAFLSAWRNINTLEDPNAFGGWLLRIARNGALNRKRKDERSRPVDEERLAVIEATQIRPEDRIGALDDPARVAEDDEIQALLWSAADALGERDREVLNLSLRYGLPPTEIADVIGLNRNAANQLVHRVRQRLATAVGARVLWRGGVPASAAFRAALAAADVDEFDAEAVRVAEKHTAGCDECTDRQRSHLSPAQMFSAVPFLAIPALKTKVAHALAAEGVPMQGVGTGGSGIGHHGRVRRGLLGAGVAGLVIAAVIAVGATRAGDDRQIVGFAVLDATTTSTTESSTTTSTSTSTSTTSPSTTTTTTTLPRTTTTRRVFVAPTTPPTAAPTTTVAPTTTTLPPPPPPPPVLTLTMIPDRAPPTYSMNPTFAASPHLAWSVQGAPGAAVTGPNVNRTELSGNIVVCPIPSGPVLCQPPLGSYVYKLDALDSAGKVIATKTVTLTIQ